MDTNVNIIKAPAKAKAKAKRNMAPFAVIEDAKKKLGIKTDKAMSEALGYKAGAVGNWRTRKTGIPQVAKLAAERLLDQRNMPQYSGEPVQKYVPDQRELTLVQDRPGGPVKVAPRPTGAGTTTQAQDLTEGEVIAEPPAEATGLIVFTLVVPSKDKDLAVDLNRKMQWTITKQQT